MQEGAFLFFCNKFERKTSNYKGGDFLEAVFHRLYETYHQAIFQYIYYIVGNRETAQELMHEVYLKVLTSYDSFAGKSSEKTWLYSIARNVAIDWLRKEKRKRRKWFRAVQLLDKADLHSDEPLPEEIVVQNEDIRLIYEALKSCTFDQQQVIILRYIQSLTVAETAKILNWSESKVKTTQHRAIQSVKKFVAQRKGGSL